MENPEEYKFCAFDFVKLELDKFQCWYLHILVKWSQEEFDRKYTLLFRYDTEKLEMAIDNIKEERALELGRAKASLFGHEEILEIEKDFWERITNAEIRLENTKRANKDFQFGWLIRKVEYKPQWTLLVIGISDDEFVPMRINELKETFHNYKVTILDRDWHKNEW